MRMQEPVKNGDPFPLTCLQAVFPGPGTNGQDLFMETKRKRVVSGLKTSAPRIWICHVNLGMFIHIIN